MGLAQAGVYAGTMPVFWNTAFNASGFVVRKRVNSHASCLCSDNLGTCMYVPPLLKAPPGGVVTRQLPAPSGSIRFSRLPSIQPPMTTDAIFPLCSDGAHRSLHAGT